jgi:pimeloyl-ACP methyl ester carboxylesterase
MRSTLLVGLAVFGLSFLAQRPGSQVSAQWRDPSPHQVRWITVDSSVRLEVLDWGGSGPPLVLLGCYLTAHVYDEFAPKLTNQFHVYGITRRGIGASVKPATGYAVQRSVDDLLEVLDSLKAQKSLLVGNSCAGQVLTMFASQHSDRLSGLVYLDGATDPTTPPYDPPLPDPTTLPRLLRPTPERDRSSFKAFTKRPGLTVAIPEAEWRQQFAENPDGSVGESLMNLAIRQAITVDARVKPNYAGIRVPVLAMYQAQRPFEEVAAEYDIRNEQERVALRQQYTAVRAMYTRWQQDLLAPIPTARIVELPGANLYMFVSNEADVLREVRAFAARLPE